MRSILIVSYYSGENTAVGSRRINALCKFFENEGYKIDLESLKNKNDFCSETQKLKSSRKKIFSPSQYFRTFDKTILSKSIFTIAKKHIKLNKKYDFVIASYKPSWSIVLGIILSKIYKTKLILEYRDLASLFGRKKRFIFIHQMDVLLDKVLLSFADHLVVVSPTQKENLSLITKQKITVIYNGIDGNIKNKFSKIDKSKKVKLFYGGVLSASRKLDKIISYLETNFNDFELTIASKNNPVDFGGNNPNVKYIGYISMSDVEIEIKKSDILIILEGNNLQSIENIPAKTFEYLKYFKPILADVHVRSDIMNILKSVDIGVNVNEADKSIFDLNPNIKNAYKYFRSNQFKSYIKLVNEN